MDPGSLVGGDSRRQFVKTLVLGGAASIVAGVKWQGTAIASVGPARAPASFPGGGGVLHLRLADFPPLAAAFGSIRLGFAALNVVAPMSPFILSRDGAKYYCVSAECTHAGCIIPSFLASRAKTSTCGCHGSRYAVDGSVLGGPATLPLSSYPLEVRDDGTLRIGLTDFPEYELRIEQVLGGDGNRAALTFFALRNVEYEVLSGETANGPFKARPFGTTPGGAVDQTIFKGNGVPATVYVDRPGTAGVLVISARVKTV